MNSDPSAENGLAFIASSPAAGRRIEKPPIQVANCPGAEGERGIPFRRDQLEAYERFAIKQAPSVPAPVSCPSTSLLRVEERLTQPAPPASKPIREPRVNGSAHLTALFPLESLDAFKDYEVAIEQLAGTCENLIQERDFWKKKVARAGKNKASQHEAEREDKRIEALRRLLARELHPDKAKSSTEEAALRAELFKQLWPEIDRIAKGQIKT